MNSQALISRLTFNSDQYIPAIIQDRASGKVLTLCYMTKEALQKTLQERFVYVFRRSQNKLMKKGETSGNIQEVLGIYPDCEGKSLLIEVKQHLAGCHKGYFSCYFEEFTSEGGFRVREERVFDPEKVYKK